ncbi:MAG: glycoside hydrolase family 127 protein [Clostridia bacterium]|nr:glycoside hydrolase family 127 protein [Clostridia bacterium]
MFPVIRNLSDPFAEDLRFITDRQLLDRALWQNCIGVFSSGIDDADRGWRGEYWGKMMRGACLVYAVTQSPALYAVLTEATEGLLARQEPSGRISAYSAENEFYGWDLWARKYVMTGLQHYYDICTDPALRGRILEALKAHADYIVARIGKGKIDLLSTGLWWGSVNSASILEPFVRLYRDTREQRYLGFAHDIIESGGCSLGSLIDCVRAGKAPFEFPEQKAYETMSFFEGLLAHYEVTGKQDDLDLVIRFADRLLETDFTAIGSCGCTHELFDHSTLRQTESRNEIMQETCVTVTLMRLLSRLFLVTDEKKYFTAVRKSALNALAGALNRNGYEQFSNEKKAWLPGMTFDSYSPLCDGTRGRGIGGFKQFADGSHFGCCACIASAGFGLYPLMCVTQRNGMISVNDPVCGDYTFRISGADVRLAITADRIRLSAPAGLRILLRVTTGDDSTRITACRPGEAPAAEADGYVPFDAADGDELLLRTEQQLTETRICGKSAFSLGGYTLAADTAKSAVYAPGRPLRLLRDDAGGLRFRSLPPQPGEQIRVCADTADGALILTDYAAAGQDGKSFVTVWF